MDGDPDITRLLVSASADARASFDELLPAVYAELRAVAQRQLQFESPGHTLQATALVHEAYLKLVDQRPGAWKSRAHFFAVAAMAIRRILVDHARGKNRLKRGSGASRVTLAGLTAEPHVSEIDLLALEEALQELAALDPRQAKIVELRFFGGLSMAETADLLGVSLRTAEGEWALARAWLRVRLRGDGAG
ncbi:MAG: hypothetical protein AMXMBFR58_25610 [Phycisphaerae bacterium]